jgi:putative membrane protein
VSPPAGTHESATLLAAEQTQLALERTSLASERTLMAWVRTSLSMISFGFTMVKFFEYLEEERNVALVGPLGHAFGPATLGLTLITLGTLALVPAVLQHRRELRRLRGRGLAPRFSLALAVASVVAALGVFAFGSLVVKY